jgi:muramoyltetrapeptide carboxypeptidase LdcA involved in peptidoglycan recycling
MIKRPEYIKKGDAIGITAPSFGPGTEPYSLMYPIAKEHITGRGYRIIEGDTIFKTDGLGMATDPEVAAAELTEFYKRDDINAIISAGGGELMNETITHVDFEELKKYPPKWFLGYSDNTNFIFPLVTITGVQGIYGPCISEFAMDWQDTQRDSFALLEGSKSSFDGYNRFVDPDKEEKSEEEPVYTEEYLRAPYALNADRKLVTFVPDKGKLEHSENAKVKIEGVLLGGCLDILTNMTGTRFDRVMEFKKENPDIIWVIEACDLNPMSIRRSLWNMREAGWFEGVKGFVIGRPHASWNQNMMGVDQYNAVTDVLKRFDVPVIMDAEIGHIDPMLPVVMGARANITVNGNDLTISYC